MTFFTFSFHGSCVALLYRLKHETTARGARGRSGRAGRHRHPVGSGGGGLPAQVGQHSYPSADGAALQARA